MEDYEINILRRDGNWKKVKPNDLIIDESNHDLIEDNEPDQKISQNDYFSKVTKVESIISRLEYLENEKSALKEELKEFEDDFLRKKKLAEDEIDKISQKKDMIEKTINVIKNLKSF
tara:strand:+ start:218 stop:568 length:351 start_codon:yes stop_codon:yes gene_type:complete